MRTSRGQSIYFIIALITVFATALLLFGYLAFETIHHKENIIDLNFAAFSVAYSNPGLVKAMKFITFFGDTGFLFISYCLLIAYFILKKRYSYSIAIFATSFGAWLLQKGTKILFQRARPGIAHVKMPTDYSFPSGHALTSFVFSCIVAWLLWQTHLKNWVKWVLMLLLSLFTLSIGASRIVLGVHYATDVIGGFTLGIMWVILAWTAWTRWNRLEKGNKGAKPGQL